jgi:hypothetical protein
MKTVIKLGYFLIIITLTLVPTSSDAFNPLAHIYIAENTCPDCSPKIDYYYGSIAPDMALYVANLLNWPTAFYDTHEDYTDIRDLAWGSTQMAFARGWLTHGQNLGIPGADYFAHIEYLGNSSDGYVIEKAGDLVAGLGWDPDDVRNFEFAHYVIEAIIDLLLKDHDHTLPGKLLFTNLFRSWKDRNLLMKVFAWRWWDRRTDWLTLALSEWSFRQLVYRYATALLLPDPKDQEALAQLGVELAKEMFDLDDITPEMLLNEILPEAIEICEDDYYDVINEAVDAVKRAPELR